MTCLRWRSLSDYVPLTQKLARNYNLCGLAQTDLRFMNIYESERQTTERGQIVILIYQTKDSPKFYKEFLQITKSIPY